MNDLDTERFWADDDLAHKENCFYEKAPQVALGIRMHNECVFAELGVPGDPWDDLAPDVRVQYNRMYNDKAEKIVGKRLLSEKLPDPGTVFPPIKRIGEIFGGTYLQRPYTGEWLFSDIRTYAQLEARLDAIDRMDLASYVLPDDWTAHKKRIYETTGTRPPVYNSVRGPVTLACSIVGEQTLIYMYVDARELFERFSKTINDVLCAMVDIMSAERGEKPDQTGGFSFFDDNCALFTPSMYEVFGYPILKNIFLKAAPKPTDHRYQHSDSDMAHLLPILSRLNLTGCNFGPTVTVDLIRKHMRRTRIDGCLAPFTFMRNQPDEIAAEIRRDIRMIKKSKTKGLNISTAGSINNGSRLDSLRLIMQIIQNEGQYHDRSNQS